MITCLGGYRGAKVRFFPESSRQRGNLLVAEEQ